MSRRFRFEGLSYWEGRVRVRIGGWGRGVSLWGVGSVVFRF